MEKETPPPKKYFKEEKISVKNTPSIEKITPPMWNVLKKIQFPSHIYTIAIIALSIIPITSIIVVAYIATITEGKGTYEGILTIASAAVGGLVGIFAHKSSEGNSEDKE